MFKSMTDDHKSELRRLIVIAILTLVLSIYHHRYVSGPYIIIVFAIIYIMVASDVLKEAFQMLRRG